MPADRTVSTETNSWQPEFIDQHATELSGYLERVSRDDALRRVAEAALELMAPLTAQSVLEVGCGNGVFLPRLAKAVGAEGRVVGIDHSEAFVEEARTKMAAAGLAATVSVQQADACRLPFADATFDRAHCERLLMHLEDPSAALSEMRRVVRPGGWIVAAEPDWGGLRIDHVDRKRMDVLYARAMRNRQPDMGMTLYRRMGELGLSERRAAPVIGVTTDLDVLKGYGLRLEPAGDAVVADGTMTRSSVDGLLSALHEANRAGRFYAVATMHVVAGRVPA
jgi:ubiquinone/menaquinone biosynthesis C-methylase UbiE